jgi:hypothetical protein
MKVKPTLMLNLHCPEGRAMVQVDLSDLSEPERLFLMDLMSKSDKGTAIGFGVTTVGRSHVIQITLMNRELEPIGEMQ